MIECQNICKTYINGKVETQALCGMSFKIEKGEFVAIIGPSGSGKSTLMHIIGALDTPTSGKYILDGKDVSKMGDDELADFRRNQIGFVFQAFNLLPRATVLRNVILPLLYSETPYKEREKKAQVAIKQAGLAKDKYSSLSNQLSGGEMQRVAIARALINNPSIILADEPTGNLDTKTSHIVMKTFQELNKQGHTIVLITHEKEIAEFADRVISMRDGRIEEDTRK
jgi:putative ABC transport system ATP-binding protein